MTDFREYAIAAPTPRLDALQRETECRAALKEGFEAMVLAAERIGWTADETALALLRLAGAHVNERVTNSVALAAVRNNQKMFTPERRNQRAGE